MRKEILKNSNGMTIVEVVVSIGIFTVLSTVAYQIYSTTNKLVLKSNQELKAMWLAEEGIEAARSIRNTNFDSLEDGTSGLTLSGGEWQLSGNTDSIDGYTRNITIASQQRVDYKDVLSTVEWSHGGIQRSLALQTTLTNWLKPLSGMADALTISQDSAYLSFITRRRLLKGIELTVESSVQNIEITEIQISWTKNNARLRNIYSPSSVEVYSGNSNESGATFTLEESINITGGSSQTLELLFDKNMIRSDFSITLVMEDGSSVSFEISDPPTGI